VNVKTSVLNLSIEEMKSLKEIIAVLSVCLMTASCIHEQYDLYDTGVKNKVENEHQQSANGTGLADCNKIYFNDSTNQEMITSTKGHQTVLK